MQDLRITIVQSTLHWEDTSANLAAFEEKMEGLAGRTDLIILPEMFTTGFSMNAAAVAEPVDGKSMEWMYSMAGELQAVVTGSVIIRDGDNFYNRLIWMPPDGQYQYYDKRHLFTLAKENETFSPGNKRLIAEYKGWKICPLICYDLRFPVWSRNTDDYDLLVYVANWPSMRRQAWSTLLRARAIENQAYTVGVNRIGKDGMDYPYSGDSTLIDYSGEVRYQVSDVENVFTASLSYEQQQEYRSKLNFLSDRDKFVIE